MHIEHGEVVSNGLGLTRRYFLVSDFYAGDEQQWRIMRQMAKSIPVELGEAIIALFLDLSQHYEPSLIGEQVGTPYRHLAIAQYVVTSEGKKLFIADPFGFGYYTEPGDTPKDFGI